MLNGETVIHPSPLPWAPPGASRGLVTVVIPAYNHAGYVSECITSVLEQDYPHVELIVINDGSTDDTDATIRWLIRERQATFRYISKENEGLIKTLNLGLKVSAGQYFCELASDDILLPGSITKRMDYLNAHPGVDAVFADAYLMNEQVKTQTRLFWNKKAYDGARHRFSDLLSGRRRIFFPTGMIRRPVMNRLQAFDEDFRYYEDLSVRYRLALEGTIAYLDEPVMYRRLHGNNTSRVKVWLRAERVLALEKVHNNGCPNSLRGAVAKHLFKAYWKYVKMVMMGRNNAPELYRTAKDMLQKAAAMKPYSPKLFFARLWFRARRG